MHPAAILPCKFLQIAGITQGLIARLHVLSMILLVFICFKNDFNINYLLFLDELNLEASRIIFFFRIGFIFF